MSTIDKLNLKSTLLEQFKVFESELNGESKKPIHKIRQEAIQTFDGLGFPTTKHEEWKYHKTSLYCIEMRSLRESTSQ